MDTWTRQKGYPVLNLSKNDGEGNSNYVVKQERFLTDPDAYDQVLYINCFAIYSILLLSI